MTTTAIIIGTRRIVIIIAIIISRLQEDQTKSLGQGSIKVDKYVYTRKLNDAKEQVLALALDLLYC